MNLLSFDDIYRRIRTGDIPFYYYLFPGLIFLAAGLIFVRAHAINVPYYDDWQGVRLVIKMVSGKLRLSSLFAQENEHRGFTERVPFLVNYLIKPWDLTRLMYLSQFLVFLYSSLFILSIRREIKMNWIVATAVPAALFSFVQFSSFLWPFCMDHILDITFFLCAVSCLLYSKDKRVRMLAVLFFAFLCEFTAAQGLLVFVSLTLLMLLLRLRDGSGAPFEPRDIFFFVFVCAILTVLYFIGWRSPQGENTLLFSVIHPLLALQFLFAFAGNIFYNILEDPTTITAGAAILIVYLFFAVRSYKRYPVLISIGSYGFLCTLAGAALRGSYGIMVAFNPKYTSPPMLLFLTVSILFADQLPEGFKRVLLAMFLVLMINLSATSLPDADKFENTRISSQYFLGRLLTSGQPPTYTSDPQTVKSIVEIVKRAEKRGIDMSAFTHVDPSKVVFEEVPEGAPSPAGEKMKWTPRHNVVIKHTKEGYPLFVSTGDDPNLYSQPLHYDTDTYREIFVKLVSLPKGPINFQIFWITNKDPEWSESKSAMLYGPISNMGYRIKMYHFNEWNHVITRIRIDPGDTGNDRVILKRFDLVPIR